MGHELTGAEQQELLRVAREAVVTQINTGCVLPVESPNSRLAEKRGCFVCIKIDGVLRGCIGNFISDKPLCELVQEMAVAAATRDPRFYPMKKQDLNDFEVEISVLSPLRKIDTIDEIQVGVHGIYLEKNFSRGVLLPQVAVEYGWDVETFLCQTSVKAGLDRDGWREGADIYIFSAQIFNDAKHTKQSR